MSALAHTFTQSSLASRKSVSLSNTQSITNARSSSNASSSASYCKRALKTFARVDGGVGVFGNKAGMTQIFTDDGLCVPVTVIAVKDGNYVSAVRLTLSRFFLSRSIDLSFFPSLLMKLARSDFWIKSIIARIYSPTERTKNGD